MANSFFVIRAIMTLSSADIAKSIDKLQAQLELESDLSPTLRSMIEMMILIIQLLANQLGLNSQNSSKPPSTDTNKETQNKRSKTTRKSGGQLGHKGATLKQVSEPDEIEFIPVDKSGLPKGRYKEVGIERRQVVDIEFSRVVTEYQAQILEDNKGKRYVAAFPPDISKAIQYGNRLKAHVVYLSQYQLLPYQRIAEYLSEQLGIPISQGSIANFNQQAADLLIPYESIAKQQLTNASLLHADETGININGKRQWLHCVSNDKWTFFSAHEKRGMEAMEDAEVLPGFKGVLCHDHWKPYYRLAHCQHALCNAHHLRGLTRAYEQDKQQWAGRMKALLQIINRAQYQSEGQLKHYEQQRYERYYKRLLNQADNECPAPVAKTEPKRGRLKRSKARNLLERLINYESDVLRFMYENEVPFTNNQGERDIRMTKVQQKISGCFRSSDGANTFCAIRGYLSTCKKQKVPASEALALLFESKLPSFCC